MCESPLPRQESPPMDQLVPPPSKRAPPQLRRPLLSPADPKMFTGGQLANLALDIASWSPAKACTADDHLRPEPALLLPTLPPLEANDSPPEIDIGLRVVSGSSSFGAGFHSFNSENRSSTSQKNSGFVSFRGRADDSEPATQVPQARVRTPVEDDNTRSQATTMFSIVG